MVAEPGASTAAKEGMANGKRGTAAAVVGDRRLDKLVVIRVLR